jgi:DNA-3-methyladenine glycosylase II
MAEEVPWAQAARQHLVQVDPDFARAFGEVGPPPRRSSPASFMTLLDVIVAQQVSKQAAATISARMRAAMAGTSPAHFLALDDEALRAVGFSRAKIAYGRDLARAIGERRLSIAALRGLDDDAAIAELSSIKGIGRWSAEVFLLFAMKRPDVMPAQDLALIVAAQRLKRLGRRPTPGQLREMAEPWRPYRSYAARFLWHYYREGPL